MVMPSLCFLVSKSHIRRVHELRRNWKDAERKKSGTTEMSGEQVWEIQENVQKGKSLHELPLL